MPAFIDDTALNAVFGVLDDANALYICKGSAPANRAAVVDVANYLATTSLTGADFTQGDHATSGRQVTVAAKSGVSVAYTGTPTYYCLVSAGLLLAYTEVNSSSPGLTAGSTVNIPAVTFSVADPTVV